ncbi:MAG: hypothetical protein LKJ25_04185 [Clostridia bacterium]|jgi:hypothetical protein|nr:hypothetical protein [Clostridia bacterium]
MEHENDIRFLADDFLRIQFERGKLLLSWDKRKFIAVAKDMLIKRFPHQAYIINSKAFNKKLERIHKNMVLDWENGILRRAW